MEKIQWRINKRAKNNLQPNIEFLNEKTIKKVQKFYKTYEKYEYTPLVNLDKFAEYLGISKVYVKDESYRFGLNSFKVLGGFYAIVNYICNKLDISIADMTFEKLISKEINEKLGKLTFITATDGNHGKGVAWVAKQLNHKAVVYMPKGSSALRYNSIKELGADVTITDFNYDDAVRMSAQNAKDYGWVVVQDTAWDGYEDIPRWIMQGYAAMAKEVIEQFKEKDKPTHIFLQAGVGSFAGAIQGFFRSYYKNECPKVIIVEADKANCYFESIKSGSPKSIDGNMDTIMAGLACGEVNTIAWDLLKEYSDCFISCPDYIAADGMRILGNPLQGDERVISGESGAVTIGLIHKIMKDKDLSQLRNKLQIDTNSKILFFNTEGDTDPENYRQIVWNGKYPSC